jgi:hypothetical protein
LFPQGTAYQTRRGDPQRGKNGIMKLGVNRLTPSIT